MAISRTFLNARIAATETAIAAYEDTFLLLASNPAGSYTLDTGQSRQTVTQMNLTEMRKTVEGLYNRLATLCARRDGGSILVVPGW